MRNLRKLLYLLSPKEQKKAVILLFMILIMAFLEMLGLVSILPFMAMLSNPEVIETNKFIKEIYIYSTYFGVQNNQQFLFFLGLTVFILLVASIAFKALTTYVQLLFNATSQYSIGKRVIEGYLNQPYSWFLNRHSADLGKTILSEVSMIVSNGIVPMMELISRSVITITILTLLLIVDTKLALIVGLTLGTAYGLVYKFTRNFLKRIGQERLKNNKWLFTAVSEAFGAVKEIKVAGLEQKFTNRYSNPAKNFAKYQASFGVVNNMPRYALETIAFGGMLLIVLYLMASSENFVNIVPILALYVVSGYRLMPALQGVYISITQLKYVGPTLNSLYKDLSTLRIPYKFDNQSALIFRKSICLKEVNYRYPNSSESTIKNINLSIKANSIVGIVGATGSGKTTLVDIILGLLEVQTGKLEVDGKLIDKNNLRTWQSSIGYVPQQIYLSDDTIAANIAFGKDNKSIDQKMVEHSAKIANLHNFVEHELPQKYQTTVGERGIRLSGGQRQRIGIARALYNKPNILILDESTNALDNLTEDAVMRDLINSHKNTTIIIITHRINTVKKCDNIFFIDKGELKGEGNFEKLIEVSDKFRETADKLKML